MKTLPNIYFALKLFAFVGAVSFSITACGAPGQLVALFQTTTPTPTATHTPTSTPTMTQTPTPSPTPSPTASGTWIPAQLTIEELQEVHALERMLLDRLGIPKGAKPIYSEETEYQDGRRPWVDLFTVYSAERGFRPKEYYHPLLTQMGWIKSNVDVHGDVSFCSHVYRFVSIEVENSLPVYQYDRVPQFIIKEHTKDNLYVIRVFWNGFDTDCIPWN